MRRQGRELERLDLRALNRATLERQLLLVRTQLPAVAAIQRTIALNAQTPNSPYLSLWSRLVDFQVEQLTHAIESRRVVRSISLRATQHLTAAADYPWLRAVLAPLLRRVQRNVFGRRLANVEVEELAEATRQLLAGQSLTRSELGRLLAERWPAAERSALAWSAQYLEPMLHPPPSGTWNVAPRSMPCVLASDWLPDEEPSDGSKSPGELLVRRYLAAYGPATVGDVRAWSGVSGLREVVDGMRTELREFADQDGRTLIDLPDLPRPDGHVPAPVRFLPEFDNLLLAYANRRRVMSDDIPRAVCVGDAVAATVLVDGTVAATWSTAQRDGKTVLNVRPFSRWSRHDRMEVIDEGTKLLEFVAADALDAVVRIDA
jgi:Winged helix DNA-binding domain